MRFEGDMEIKGFIDVPLSEFFTFHVCTTFYVCFRRDGAVFKATVRSGSKEEEERPDSRACCQLSRGLSRKSATHLCSKSSTWPAGTFVSGPWGRPASASLFLAH